MSAEWDAECVEGDQVALRSPALGDLEAEIFEHLEGSWCSGQKAKMLIELVVLTRPAVVAEIGAFSGSTTLPLLAGLRHVGSGRGYVVEAWSNAEAIRGLPADDAHTLWWESVDMATVRAQFDQMLETWSLRSWCEVIAEASGRAVSTLPAIDLLHLDGNFSQEGAALDSEQYLPKVVAGGHVVLSNALATVAGQPTKMLALWPLFDACDIVCEVDGGNTLLFRKR